jgi:C4-dicarboxylate transporter DctQ subunit
MADSIKLLTMHVSKGLEFPVVALCGVGRMPGRGPRRSRRSAAVLRRGHAGDAAPVHSAQRRGEVCGAASLRARLLLAVGEETARYTFVYLTWLGAAYAIKIRAHIRIDLLSNALPPRGQALLNILASVCAIVFACFALYWSLEPVAVSFRFGSVSDGLRITKAWFLLAVPLGFALVLWRALQSLHIDLSDLRHGSVTTGSEKLFD